MTLPLPRNFKAEELENGSLLLRDVPIFAKCSKQGHDFGDEWIDQAVQYHVKMEANGGASVVHIGHNGDHEPVHPAGAWTNTRKAPIRAKNGSILPGIIADLLLTNEDAIRRAKRGELLWRSPEIPRDRKTGKVASYFRSLALLDRHAPHNDDLPVLTFQDEAGAHNARKADAAHEWTRFDAGPVLAFNATDATFVALMEPEAMPNTTTQTETTTEDLAPLRLRWNGKRAVAVDPEGNERPIHFQQEPGESSSESEGDEGGGATGWKAALEALKSVEIPLEEVPEAKAAICEFADSLEAGEEAEAETETSQTVDNELGDMGMSNTDKTVDLQAEVVTLRKRLDERDQTEARDKAIDAAHDLLKGRGFNRDEVVKFASDVPTNAIESFAKRIADKMPERDASFEKVIGGAAASQTVPDEVLKFQSDPDVYEHAMSEWRSWSKQDEARKTRIPLARWLDINGVGGEVVQFARSGVEE